MLSDRIAAVDIGPGWLLERTRRKLQMARISCEVLQLVPGFVALYINEADEARYRAWKLLE
jgi:hypothetical protein